VGVSRERVRQVELKTKNFLARYLRGFDPDLEPLAGAAEAARVRFALLRDRTRAKSACSHEQVQLAFA